MCLALCVCVCVCVCVCLCVCVLWVPWRHPYLRGSLSFSSVERAEKETRRGQSSRVALEESEGKSSGKLIHHLNSAYSTLNPVMPGAVHHSLQITIHFSSVEA